MMRQSKERNARLAFLINQEVENIGAEDSTGDESFA